MSAPHHPASNRLTEDVVQIHSKKWSKKLTEGAMSCPLALILFAYRLTSQSTMGVSPSELLLSRRPHCRFDLMKPNILQTVENKQLPQKINHGTTANVRFFTIMIQYYIVKNFNNTGQKWL